ncbi:hypothetical protein FF125_11065 [Aureibaculum algae]|uniref:Uncharacterized protein n=1 Tax=Aureibaculum algae TaxID=2584122 RepID=A0A5B7TRW3_9FLAO|nr:hypothetical protein [Aureibaculum algae]QCX38948.1 hypothetical protein FF125_11065 [Aureibaculum algae]
MARRLYSICIVIAILLGVYLNTFKQTHSTLFIIIIATLLFFLLSLGVHGLIAHTIKPSIKDSLVAYPLIMGAIWAIMLLIFIFFIIPLFCPHFVYGL